MAQAYWQAGVAVPVPNHSFRFGTYKSDTLNSAYASGLTLHVNSDLRNFYAASDYIVVGPNTSGISEARQITAVNATNIVVLNSLDNNYAVSESISGIGRQLAAAWSAQQTYASGLICQGINNAGKEDNSAQKFRSTLTNGNVILRNTIDAGNLIESTVYRHGFYYKYIKTDSVASLKNRVHDGSSYFMAAANVAVSDVSTYTSYTRTGTTSASGMIGNNSYIDIYVDGDTPVDVNATIDHVFLEHATDTDDAASGFYTFTEYPEQNSIRWNRISALQPVVLRNFQRKIFDSSGSEGRQFFHSISARFENVSSTFYNNLNQLLNWQAKGNYLSLHMEIPKIPPTLIGVMTLTDLGQNIWDSSKISVTLNFEEAI